jgi:UDP:flavonoid glycosyltransferase YjiC (YdhE family)
MDTSSASRTTASGSPPTGKRVVVTAFGSLGDLYPYLAIALGLKSRGHEAVLVTSACYRRKVEALGLGFRAMRPDSTSWTTPP